MKWWRICLLLCLLIPANVRASVVINEIFYDAIGSDDNKEWIEIYNPDSTPYDLTGWKFFEGNTQHGFTLSQGSFTLSSNSFAIIAENAQTFPQDHSNFTGNLYDSSFSLSNTGETISLLDGPSGSQVDSVSYLSSWGGGEGISLERISYSTQSNESTNWHNGPPGGSPGAQNVLPSPTPTPTPTPTPNPTPTPTPLPALATPKALQAGTPTPKLSPTPKPSSPPLTSPSPVGSTLPAGESGVLAAVSDTSMHPTPTGLPSPTPRVLGTATSGSNWLAVVVIVIGGVVFAAAVYLLIRRAGTMEK